VNAPWTAWGDPAAEKVAGHLLEGLTQDLLKAWGRLLDGLLVVGGYGRGEGSLLRTSIGGYRPWNDVDLVLLRRPGEAPPAGWHGQADAWAAHWDLDSVDLVWAGPAEWRRRPSSLFHVEVRAGHRVLWGSGAAAELLPAGLARGERLREAHWLLANRGFALLLLGLPGLLTGQRAGASFRLNALLKARLAVGDARLLAQGRLPLRYAERPAALRSLGAPAEVLAAHAGAVELKLRPTEAWASAPRDVPAEARAAARLWLAHGPLALAGTDAAGYPGYVAARLGSWRRRLRRALAGGGGRALEPAARLGAGVPLLMAGFAEPAGWDPAPLAALWPGEVSPDAPWSQAAARLCEKWLEGK